MMKCLKSDKNIWALLKRNLSKGQLLGYVISNIIGLSVILTGIMFYLDSNHSSDNDEKFFLKDYIVLSKKVEGIGFNAVNFDKDEINDLRKQSWVKRIGRFTSSQYTVFGSIEMGGRGLSSYLFFESVPDDFFDVKPRDWEFNPDKKFVPIILSKDYLTLYNFGFAIPQGLPQVSENVINAVPLKLRLSGKDQLTETFDAAIVGFSSRLNTIAVPQSFMDWANQRYSIDSIPNPSRLIVEIDRLSGEDPYGYLEAHDIEVAGDKSNESNVSKFLSASSLVVTTNGILISSLAVFILILSIFLLLQKSKEKIRYLMLLGYSPNEISSYYERIVVGINVIVTVVAVVVSLFVRRIWSTQLSEIGLGNASILPMLLLALGYLILVTMLNIFIIRKFMMEIWNNK